MWIEIFFKIDCTNKKMIEENMCVTGNKKLTEKLIIDIHPP